MGGIKVTNLQLSDNNRSRIGGNEDGRLGPMGLFIKGGSTSTSFYCGGDSGV